MLPIISQSIINPSNNKFAQKFYNTD